MDLRQLRYFVAIVEQGSLSRAAVVLQVAQPALSLHIRNMEADLGTALLVRNPQGVRPTQAGTILYRDARAIIAKFEETRQAILGQENTPEGEVTIACGPLVAPDLLATIVARARKRFPRLRLKLRHAADAGVTDAVRSQDADIGLAYLPSTVAGIVSTKVLEDEFVLVGPAAGVRTLGLEPVEGDAVTMEQLAALTLALPAEDSALRTTLLGDAEEAGTMLQGSVDISALSVLASVMDVGAAYAVLPKSVVEPEVARGRFRCWSIHEPRMTAALYLTHATEQALNPAVSAILKLCTEVCEKPARDGDWSPSATVRPRAKPSPRLDA